jgi:hypothetical protein
MVDLSIYLVLIGCVMVIILDRYLTNKYIESKGNKEYRTPICINGKFFYIIPEKEYLERDLKYHELLGAVENKFEGETRHETALRYIREREAQSYTGSTTNGG